MKVLVTGAAGFLGTALIERLLAHGYSDIRCNVRRPTDIPKLETLARRHPHSRLEYSVGNLRYREDAARAVEGVQLIFHLAAGKKGTCADLFLDSVVASRNLLDAVADRKPLRIVLVSSFGVYGVAGLRRGAEVDEQTPLEPHPELRDHYSYSKLRQEQLFWEYQRRNGFELVVLRPGVIYGPGGGHFSNRVGLTIGRWQLHFGGNNLLPLSYVDNCAEAIVVSGNHPHSAGQIYNVHDDELPTCRQYTRAYKKNVANISSISVPYFVVKLLSHLVARYHVYSKGQLPAILTPYKSACLWGGNRFNNTKLCSLGWSQVVSAEEGLRISFEAFRAELNKAKMNIAVLPLSAEKLTEVATAPLSSNPEEFVVGAVLGPDSKGSFHQLLSAFSFLRKTDRLAKLLIFDAHGPHQLQGESSVGMMNADQHWVRDGSPTRELLQSCDVLVSLQDGVPVLVLQAMSAGIPIITTAVRTPEALENQPTVTFLRQGDQTALGEKLLQLSALAKTKCSVNLVPDKKIAEHYSDTYLWRENNSHSPNGHKPKVRALIKKVLYSAVPDRQLLKHGNRERAQIALTIDDGPDPVYTPRILDILRDLAVKATFFVVGGAAEQYPEIIERMKKEGHEIGSHSYSHPYFHRLSWSGALREIRLTRWVLDRILGEECKLFRPPHGKLSLRSLIPAWAAGQHVVMWNVDLKDYRASPGDVEAQVSRTSFSAGDIILYHGVNEPALKALPCVIQAARANGREAVTISELTQH